MGQQDGLEQIKFLISFGKLKLSSERSLEISWINPSNQEGCNEKFQVFFLPNNFLFAGWSDQLQPRYNLNPRRYIYYTELIGFQSEKPFKWNISQMFCIYLFLHQESEGGPWGCSEMNSQIRQNCQEYIFNQYMEWQWKQSLNDINSCSDTERSLDLQTSVSIKVTF